MSSYKLLTESNAKTPKGEAKGFLTAILYLAPNTLSGHNVCPAATPGCIDSCLYYAGHGRFTKVQEGRIRKTLEMTNSPSRFVHQLEQDIEALTRRAAKRGLSPVVRLNGTSDLAWEKLASEMFIRFSDVQFYDYTKLLERMKAFVRGKLPPNYHLTFSITPERFGEFRYIDTVKRLIKKGCNATFVHSGKSFDDIRKTWSKFPPPLLELASVASSILDGDQDDLRFTEKGALIALRAKGRAKQDQKGFVVRL